MSCDKVVSTRLLLSGHNFSEEFLPAAIDEAVVLLDTEETLLVPADIYEEGMQTGYVLRSGMDLTEDKSIVVSPAVNGMVALMLFPKSIVETLVGRFGRCEFRSPLQEIAGEKNATRLFSTARCTYMTFSDDSLRFADVIADRSTDTVLYLLQTLNKEYGTSRMRIKVGGEDARRLAGELSVYYKKVEVCE